MLTCNVRLSKKFISDLKDFKDVLKIWMMTKNVGRPEGSYRAELVENIREIIAVE